MALRPFIPGNLSLCWAHFGGSGKHLRKVRLRGGIPVCGAVALEGFAWEPGGGLPEPRSGGAEPGGLGVQKTV